MLRLFYVCKHSFFFLSKKKKLKKNLKKKGFFSLNNSVYQKKNNFFFFNSWFYFYTFTTVSLSPHLHPQHNSAAIFFDNCRSPMSHRTVNNVMLNYWSGKKNRETRLCLGKLKPCLYICLNLNTHFYRTIDLFHRTVCFSCGCCCGCCYCCYRY